MTPPRGILYWIERRSMNCHRKNFIHKQLGKCFWEAVGFGVGPESIFPANLREYQCSEQNKAIWVIAGCFLLCPKCFISELISHSFFLLWFCVRKGFSIMIIYLNSSILGDTLWFYFSCLNMLSIYCKAWNMDLTLFFSQGYPNVTTVCSIIFVFPYRF